MALGVSTLGLGFKRRGVGATYPAILDDGNTVAWFDYLENITKDGSDLVSIWGDKSGLDHHLLQATGTNQPIVNANGVLFDGIDNFMKCAAFTLVQPEMIYMVLKQVTWSVNDRIFDGENDLSMLLSQKIASANIDAYAGDVLSNNDSVLNTYGILRVLYNGASSKLIINNNTPVTGSLGSADADGFIIGRRTGSDANYSNIEVKEIIIRKVADISQDEQEIYNYLDNKYADFLF